MIILTKFSLKVKLECISKKCCPTQRVGEGFTFDYDYEVDWKLGSGCRPTCFRISDGNGCCYSSELHLCKDFNTNIKCPQCGKENIVEII